MFVVIILCTTVIQKSAYLLQRRVQFDRRIQVCKNSIPLKHQPPKLQQHPQQKKSTPLFRDDMFIGKTSGYNTPAKPRTRKPLESCPGNIPITINSSPSTNSDNGENENIDQQTSFSSENETDYYSRYKYYKRLSKTLSHENYLLQLRLLQSENSSTSNAMVDPSEIQRLRNENSELRSRYNQLTIDIERSLNYQKPLYYPPQSHIFQQPHRNLPLFPSHHQQQQHHGYLGFNPRPYPSSTATSNFPQYSPTFDIPRNFSANGQYDPSETDNTDQGEHDKNIFGNSIPKVAASTAHPSTPVKLDEDIC